MNIQKYIPLVARIFLAVIFVQTGLNKFASFAGTQEQIASAGIPLPLIATVLTILIEVIGGISLILGFKAKIGALLLVIFLIPVTLVFHNPIADGSQMIAFMKNLAIMGGLLMVVAFGPGAVSIDGNPVSQQPSPHVDE